LGSLVGKTVLLLGAGNMADLALFQLRKRQVGQIVVVNRTLAKAEALAGKYDGKAFLYEQLADVMPLADVLICSKGSPHTLITRQMVDQAMRLRPHQKLAILDIAVPRDVDETVDSIPGVWRCDIDDLQTTADQSIEARKSAIPDVEAIIRSEVEHFMRWLVGHSVEETVAEFRRKTEEIRDSEFQRLLSILPELTPETLQIVERFSHSLTNKLLHQPTLELRRLDGTLSAANHGEAVRDLSGLMGQKTNRSSVEAYSV
jgi:glutamyl-tRNA reductase